jgi:hypothetical protein
VALVSPTTREWARDVPALLAKSSSLVPLECCCSPVLGSIRSVEGYVEHVRMQQNEESSSDDAKTSSTYLCQRIYRTHSTRRHALDGLAGKFMSPIPVKRLTACLVEVRNGFCC